MTLALIQGHMLMMPKDVVCAELRLFCRQELRAPHSVRAATCPSAGPWTHVKFTAKAFPSSLSKGGTGGRGTGAPAAKLSAAPLAGRGQG